MNVIPFEPKHLVQMDLQEAQRHSVFCEAYGAELVKLGPCYTAETDRIIACAGLCFENGESMLWTFVARNAPLLALTRAAGRLFQVHPRARIVATTEVAFRPGCRWLQMMGFRQDGILAGFGPDGVDHFRYVRDF